MGIQTRWASKSRTSWIDDPQYGFRIQLLTMAHLANAQVNPPEKNRNKSPPITYNPGLPGALGAM